MTSQTLSIQLQTDVKDLQDDLKAGLFEKNHTEYFKRQNYILKKVGKLAGLIEKDQEQILEKLKGKLVDLEMLETEMRDKYLDSIQTPIGFEME